MAFINSFVEMKKETTTIAGRNTRERTDQVHMLNTIESDQLQGFNPTNSIEQ